MRKSTLSGITALLLAGIMAGGVCACGIGSNWFTNGDIKTWFNCWGKGVEVSQPNQPENNGNVVVTPDKNNGFISLTTAPLMLMSDDGIERAVPDSYVLTASAVVNSSFEWSYNFENVSSEWANGKNINDYESFTVSADTRQLTLRAKQAFGEPIIITCKPASNIDIVATCKVDYIKRVSSATFFVNKGGSEMFELGNVNSFEIKPVYTVGTVSGEFAITKVNCDLCNTLSNYMRYDLGELSGQVDFCLYSFECNKSITPFDFFTTSRGDYRYLSNCQLAYNTMLSRANESWSAQNDCYLIMSLNYTYLFNGVEVQSGITEDKNQVYSAGSLTPYNVVTSVSLDKTNIYQ